MKLKKSIKQFGYCIDCMILFELVLEHNLLESFWEEYQNCKTVNQR